MIRKKNFFFEFSNFNLIKNIKKLKFYFIKKKKIKIYFDIKIYFFFNQN
jgi:hypothetical protein